MADTKVMIVATFHRFVAVEGKSDRREIFAAGQTVTVSQGEADDWIAKGLARAVAPPEAAARERGDFTRAIKPTPETDPA